MSTIQEIVSTNYLYEDKTAFDPSWLQGKDFSNSVSSFHKNQASLVVAIAEIVQGVAQGALLLISYQFLNSEQLISFLSIHAFLKLLSPTGYTKEDIEKFQQRKTYVEYLKARAELVACLSAKEKGLWLLNECFSKTLRKVAGVAFLSLTSQNFAVFARNPLLQPTLRCVGVFFSSSVLGYLIKDVLDFAEAHLHSYVYHLAEKNQAQLI
jgi:hypothetical protein